MNTFVGSVSGLEEVDEKSIAIKLTKKNQFVFIIITK